MLLWSPPVCGYEQLDGPLGTFDSAKRAYPELFIPGLVQQASIQGESSYVICVSTQRDFSSVSHESAAELLQELELSAKYLLLMFVSNNQPEHFDITLEHFSSLYVWQDGTTYFANYSVAVHDVDIQKKIAPIPQKSPTIQAGTHDAPQEVTAHPDNIQTPIDEKSKYTRLVESEIDLYTTLLKLANIYLDEQEYKVASTYYEHFLSLYEDKTSERETALYQLAVCRENMNDIKQAIIAYETFRKEFPFSERNSEVLTRINNLKIKEVTENPQYKN